MRKFKAKRVIVCSVDSWNANEWCEYFKDKDMYAYPILKKCGEWYEDFQFWVNQHFETVELQLEDFTIIAYLTSESDIFGDRIFYPDLSDEDVYFIFYELERVW